MKIAIMQPYVFPYMGYYQLVKAVDKFIVYDDVTFIKQGWINRNRILVNGKEFMFTIPLKAASSNKLILETKVENIGHWKTKFMKTLSAAYSKSPFFSPAIALIDDIIDVSSDNISALAVRSIKQISAYLGVDTTFVDSSSGYKNATLKSQERIIDICRQENANEYLNPIGGTELYNKELFSAQAIQLNFIKATTIPYAQMGEQFVPHLSIIDVIMQNSSKNANYLLQQYQII